MKNHVHRLSNNKWGVNPCNFLIRSVHYPKYLSYLITDIKLYNNFLLKWREKKDLKWSYSIVHSHHVKPRSKDIVKRARKKDTRILMSILGKQTTYCFNIPSSNRIFQWYSNHMFEKLFASIMHDLSHHHSNIFQLIIAFRLIISHSIPLDICFRMM